MVWLMVWPTNVQGNADERGLRAGSATAAQRPASARRSISGNGSGPGPGQVRPPAGHQPAPAVGFQDMSCRRCCIVAVARSRAVNSCPGHANSAAMETYPAVHIWPCTYSFSSFCTLVAGR